MYITMAQSPQFLTDFNNAIGRLNGLTTTAQNDSARLNLERQNFIRDATGGLATMSQAVATLRIRVTAYVAELERLRQEVAGNNAIVAQNLAEIVRLNDEIDALRQQGPRVAPGSPAINNRYADIQMLQTQIQELTAQNVLLEQSMRAATPLLARIEAVFGQINANAIPTGPLLAEITRLNVEIQAILALLPALPGSGSGSGSGGPPPPGSGSGGFFSGLFGSSGRPNPVGVAPRPVGVAPRPDVRSLGGQSMSASPLISTPAQGVQASFQPQVGSVTPSSFFPDNLNNELRQKPPASSFLGFGGKRKKSKKQKGGYIYNPSTKHTFKSPRRTKTTTRSTGKSTKRSTGRSTKRSTSRRRTKRVKI
jgi:hypothetical protein